MYHIIAIEVHIQQPSSSRCCSSFRIRWKQSPFHHLALLISAPHRAIPQTKKTMSRRNRPKLDLKLNLSPPWAAGHRPESPTRSLTVSPTSPPSSCVSSEEDDCLRYSSSPEATSMMLVGCPRCLMYVMLAEEDPRCPKCKSTVLLDVVHDNNTTIKTASKKA